MNKTSKTICVVAASALLFSNVYSGEFNDSFIACYDDYGNQLDTWFGLGVAKVSPNPDNPSFRFWSRESQQFGDEVCGSVLNSHTYGYLNVCSFSRGEYRIITEYVGVASQDTHGETLHHAMTGIDLSINRATGVFELENQMMERAQRELHRKQTGVCVPVTDPELSLPKPMM